ncbi:MAG: DUF2721 domain-containing protein [Burkholderiales bacterium]
MTSNAVLNAIQLAVAPVFMLTAIAAMIGTVATRLARIIDRARELEERLELGTLINVDAAYWELNRLKLRGRICNWSVGLLGICGMLIAATVMVLFLGETALPRTEQLVPWTFLGALGIFVIALVFFLLETFLAIHTLRFGKHSLRK